MLTKGEHILQIAEICRKLETEREKVTPFYRKKNMFEKDENELKKPPEDFKEVISQFKIVFPLSILENTLGNNDNFVKNGKFLDSLQ